MGYPLPSLEVATNQKKKNGSEAVIHMPRKYATKVPNSASGEVLSRMKLTLRKIRRTPHGRYACGSRDACLVGANPMCSVLALQGCEGLLVICTTTVMREMSTPTTIPSPLPHA